MKTSTTLLAIVAAAFSISAQAASHTGAAPMAASAAPTAHQTKMATCNKDAGDKKGDERKKFMSSCLSG